MSISGKPLGDRRPRILVVDDEAAATRMLGKLLQKCGYDVAEQNDSNKAHALARRYRPDLIILDIFMPWKTGNELAAVFESDEELRDVPLIFITAHALLEERLSHSHRVLIKPFSVEELFGHIETALLVKTDGVTLHA
jgi:chemosensory pili system protein ChpA (sensor histidine kinase/response regulator)